jgi:hypothetical protein
VKVGDTITVRGCDWHDVHRRTARISRLLAHSVWVRWSCGSLEMFRRDTGQSVDLWRAGETQKMKRDHVPTRYIDVREAPTNDA